MPENWPETVEGLYKNACSVIFSGTIIGSTIKEECYSIEEPNEKHKNWIMSKKYVDENHLISPKALIQSLWDFNTL